MAEVTLVSPSGVDYVVSEPSLFVTAVYAWGYRPKTGTIDQARATLREGAPTPPYNPGSDTVTVGELQDSSSPASAALRVAFVAGGVLNNNGTVNTTKKLMARLTADGTDIDDLFIVSA